MLAEREGAFVESFLRAFQLLRTAAQNHYLVQAWTVRAFHVSQRLRLSWKSRFLSKTPPFLFQLSGIGMFLAVLLPILEPPVPPDLRTPRPQSPRLTAHRFVESLPGVFYLPGIAPEPVLPAPQRIEFVVFAANVQSTRHSHALKVISCRHLPLPLSIFLEGISSSFSRTGAHPIPLPFPEIRNPKRTAATLVPVLSYFPKHKKQRQALRLPLSLCRRQLIFPGRLQPSIVSTCELNFRVRYGNGWTLTVINTYYCAPAH